MNAHFPGFEIPILLVRFAARRPGKGCSETLDIGSAKTPLRAPIRPDLQSHRQRPMAIVPGLGIVAAPRSRHQHPSTSSRQKVATTGNQRQWGRSPPGTVSVRFHVCLAELSPAILP